MRQDEVILVSAVALLMVGYLASYRISNDGGNTKKGSKMKLAERNKNPLNIRYNPGNNWVGQSGHNAGFAVFVDDIYGYRAAFVLLNNYVKQGFNTIDKIVNRWAPASENPTENYIRFVEDRTGLWANTPITQADYFPIIEAMAVFEGGKVDKKAAQSGYKLAFG